MAKQNKNTDKVVEQSILGVENSTPDIDKIEADKIEADKKSGKTYIMKTTHLSWGPKKSNHFYAYKKPTISKKVMGKNHGKIIDIWLEAEWIEEGKY